MIKRAILIALLLAAMAGVPAAVSSVVLAYERPLAAEKIGLSSR